MDQNFELASTGTTQRTEAEIPAHPDPEDRENDSTLKSIHKLSQDKDKDSTREQISKYSHFSVSEALGLPLLSGDAAPASSATRPAWVKSNSPGIGASISSVFDLGGPSGASVFEKFTSEDRKAMIAASAMLLLPLLGGYFFSR